MPVPPLPKSRMSWSYHADSFRTLKDVASRLCDSPDIKSRHDALMYIVWRVALDIKEWRTLSHSEAAVQGNP